MLAFDFLFGFIGIIVLTAFCLPGAFMVPSIAYWFMTPYACGILKEYGIKKKMSRKDIVKIALLITVAGVLFIATVFIAGIQGVNSGMGLWRLSLRFLIFFWMVSIFDAVVLDWWMFTKTDIFGVLIKKKTGKTPEVTRVDPQWDGKEFLKLALEVVISVVLAWLFIKFG